VVNADQWEGNPAVNLKTAVDAGRVLHGRLCELESEYDSLCRLLWPVVSNWPLCGASPECLLAFAQIAKRLGIDQGQTIAGAIQVNRDQLADNVVSYVEQRWLRRMATDCRREFLQDLRDVITKDS